MNVFNLSASFALMIGILSIPLFGHASSCNVDSILLQVGGINDFKAGNAREVGRMYFEYKQCPAALSTQYNFHFLVELGMAYQASLSKPNKQELEWLKKEASAKEDLYVLAILRYYDSYLNREPALKRFEAYKQAADLIEQTPFKDGLFFARIQRNLAKYIVRTPEIQQDFSEHFSSAIRLYHAHNKMEMVVSIMSIMAQDVADHWQDSVRSRNILDSLKVYCEEHFPTGLPAYFNSLGFYYHVFDRPKSVAAYFEAADLCIEQKKSGEVSRDCPLCIANAVVIGMANRKLNEIEAYINLMPEFSNGTVNSSCSFFLTQSNYQNLLGNCKKALVFAQWADACYTQIRGENHGNRANIFDAEIQALDCLGDLPGLREKVNQAITFHKKAGKWQQVGKTYANLAVSYANNGKHEKAYEIFHNDSIEIVETQIELLNKANILRNLNFHTEANVIYSQLLKEKISAERRAEIFNSKAEIAIAQEQFRPAKAYLDSGFLSLKKFTFKTESNLNSSLGSLNFQYDHLLLTNTKLLFEIYLKSQIQEVLDSALVKAYQTEKQLNFLSRAGNNSKAQFAKFAELKELQSEILLHKDLSNQGVKEQFAQIMANSKSRELINTIARNEYTKSVSQTDYSKAARALNSRIQSELELVEQEIDQELAQEIAAQFSKLKSIEDQYLKEVGYESRGLQLNLISELQNWAQTNHSQVLSYMVNNSNLFILQITSKETKIHHIPISEAILKGAVVDLQEALENSRLQETDSLISKLSNLLIPMELEDLGAPNVSIIADKFLGMIPFEVLRTGSGSAIGELFNTVYHHSFNLMMKGSSDGGKVEILSVAPEYRMDHRKTEKWGNRSRWLFQNSEKARNGSLPLSNNVREGTDAIRLFNGNLLSGNTATEKNFTDALREQKILHLSMHGFNHDKDPMLSGLVFSNAFEILPQDTSKTFKPEFFQNDGILHAFEIYDMRISTDLVILSACHSGTGTYKKGEGTMSLARAFMAAGAKSVVMSLWQVDDESTSEIVTEFLRNLKKGMRKSEALAEAKRTFRENNQEAPPYYWAGLVLVGNDDPISDPGIPFLPFALSGLVILFGGFMGWRKISRAA